MRSRPVVPARFRRGRRVRHRNCRGRNPSACPRRPAGGV